MKKIINSLVAIVALCGTVNAQNNNALVVNGSNTELAAIYNQLHISNIIGKKYKVATVNAKTYGTWTKNKDYSTWILNVHSMSNCGVITYFDELILPIGSSVYAHSANGQQHTRHFGANENRQTKAFALPAIYDEDVIVEAQIPTEKVSEFSAIISEIGLTVDGWDSDNKTAKITAFGDADTCYINANCSIVPAIWSNPKRSVVQYTYTTGTDIGNCTGALVNNTAQDCKNYFLSAQHCAIEATDLELGQTIFYFNYEAPSCSNPTSSIGLMAQTVVGCSRVAASGGRHAMPPDGSDFRLLLLNTIPASYNVYYSGWNRNDAGTGINGNGVIIHHPLADIKKISFWDSYTTSGTSIGDFYVNCIQLSGRGGTVEPMSSGSPVFDVNQQIVGTISYGNTGCVKGNSSPFAAGGKMYYHWGNSSLADTLQLKHWLDPTNSGVMTLVGKNACGSSINEINPKRNTVVLFPNPASEAITIESSDELINTIKITDITGKILLQETANVYQYFASISHFPKGVYIVIVNNKKYLKFAK